MNNTNKVALTLICLGSLFAGAAGFYDKDILKTTSGSLIAAGTALIVPNRKDQTDNDNQIK